MFIAPGYAYHWPAFPDFPGSWVVQFLGVVLSGAGGFLCSRAAQTLGREMTPSIQVHREHRLVQSGVYRYIRHPVYTATVVLAIGQSLFFLSSPPALQTLLLFGLAVYRARPKVALLTSPAGFGATYQASMSRTGRFLPRLRLNEED
ncbi:MAG: isoprenylcysteine carboxylmethyltransferase family protein [Thermoplasmata archaeon]